MKFQIFQVGESILREQAKELSIEEIHSPFIQQLIEFMQNTMLNTGVGLAAPQIGESLQLIVIEDRPEYIENLTTEQRTMRERVPIPFHVLINPKIIIEPQTDYVEFYEGCLSVAGFMGLVPRAKIVKVECLNENAEPITINASGWYARILQHEIDHLQGALYIDHMKSKSFTTLENYIKYCK
jgi:peptide deformylase